MTLDLTCTECEASFELDVQDLLDAPKSLNCPNCEAKAPSRRVESLASALDDLMRAMKELAPKFAITVAAETDDVVPKSAADEEEGEAEIDGEDEDRDLDDEDDEDEDEDEDEVDFDR